MKTLHLYKVLLLLTRHLQKIPVSLTREQTSDLVEVHVFLHRNEPEGLAASFGSIVTSVAAGYIIIVLLIRRMTLPVVMCAQAAHSLTASVAISCSILID